MATDFPSAQAAPHPSPVGPFEWLRVFGAQFRDAGEIDFGDLPGEAAAALSADIVAPLADRGVILARGKDAETFLQGQLSNDLRELTPDRAQLSSYSSPKGRVLAVFTLMRTLDNIWLETQNSLLETTLKRLRMFVLRSKLTLENADTRFAALGLAGPNACALLAEIGLPIPELDWACAEAAGIVVLRCPGVSARFTLHGDAVDLQATWERLGAQARPVGTQAWRLLDLLAGLPAIRPETADRHVAQMLNLDTLSGISFTKGCYPGQEIVARLHYLGNLKRRLFLGYARLAEIARCMPVYVDDGAQSIGEVLDFTIHPTEGKAVQIVLQLGHQNAANIRLGAPDGPVLKLIA